MQGTFIFPGQARLDGAFCDYSEESKLAFLKRAYERGVRNIEMESLCFAAMTHRAGVKSKFEPRSCQTKDYKVGICCFTAKQAALRRMSRDWLAQNQNNVSEWSDMSTRGLLFQ